MISKAVIPPGSMACLTHHLAAWRAREKGVGGERYRASVDRPCGYWLTQCYRRVLLVSTDSDGVAYAYRECYTSDIIKAYTM